MTKYSKYNNKFTVIDGIKFDSMKEANRYCELKILKKANEVNYFLRQVPFDLPGNVKYRVDFQIFWSNGDVTYEDVKGYKTQTYIMKKKMVEALYPVEILEV